MSWRDGHLYGGLLSLGLGITFYCSWPLALIVAGGALVVIGWFGLPDLGGS